MHVTPNANTPYIRLVAAEETSYVQEMTVEEVAAELTRLGVDVGESPTATSLAEALTSLTRYRYRGTEVGDWINDLVDGTTTGDQEVQGARLYATAVVNSTETSTAGLMATLDELAHRLDHLAAGAAAGTPVSADDLCELAGMARTGDA